MIESADILMLGREAMMLSLLISLPILGAVLLSALLSALLQSVSKISETTLSVVPRIVAVIVTLVFAAPWIGGEVATFAVRVWSIIQAVDV